MTKRRARLLLLVPGALALATGCSVLAGVDFGAVHARDDGPVAPAGTGDDGGGGPPDGGRDSTVAIDAGVLEEGGSISRTDGGCAADEATCNGACVKRTDPQFGCGDPACKACSLPGTATAKCVAGACAPDKCAPGRAHCSVKPADGCEADLTSPATCGGCTTKCAAPTPLCSPTGCVGSCPVGTTLCGTQCVDTQTSATNCQTCGTICATFANSDPACIGGKCGISCHAGFQDCDGNPNNGCEPLTTFYKDGDGDGVGGASTMLACAAPSGFAARGGDCDDTNARVFPGQATYFGTPYTNPAGAVTYDYDCDGNEVESASTLGDHFIGTCGAGCDNLGYLSTGRTGAGVDAYCGSTRYRTCVSTLAPSPAGPGASLPVGGTCTSPVGTQPAVGCK